MRTFVAWTVLSVVLATSAHAQMPEMPVYESAWQQLNFEGVKPGDWVEYSDSGSRAKTALLKADDKTRWIETNTNPMSTADTYIVELDAKTGLALRAWKGKPGGEATPVKLEKFSTSDWTEEEKKEFEASKPKFSNRTGKVSREKVTVAKQELDCEKVVDDHDVEEKSSLSDKMVKYHDRWTHWYSEEVPAFERAPGPEWNKDLKWEGAHPSSKGGEVRMTRENEKGQVRWEKKLVAFGHDAKATLKVKEFEEAK